MSWFSNLWDGITSSFNQAGNWVNNNIIKPVGTGLENASNWVNDNIINPTKDFVNNEIIQPVGNWINETTNKVQESAKENGVISAIGTGIGETVGKVVEEGKKLGDAVQQPIINAITGKETESEPSKEINEKEQEQQNTETFNPNGNSNPTQESKVQETPQEQAQSMLERAWEREDKIRKETQEREDNAYQRAISDMRKSGINPNLVGINPANSGGGITSATMPESTLSAQISAYSNELIAELARELELSENKKDRLTEILGRGLSGLASIIAFK